jgi:outer membrane murein-binding lipoprotein Lpp
MRRTVVAALTGAALFGAGCANSAEPNEAQRLEQKAARLQHEGEAKLHQLEREHPKQKGQIEREAREGEAQAERESSREELQALRGH